MHKPTFIKMGSRIMAAISPGNCLKRRSTLARVVERGYRHVVDAGLGHAEAAGHGSRRVDVAILFGFGLHADQGSVVQTVIGAFKFEDFVALGGGTGHATCVHGDFRAAGAEAHHFTG